MCATATIWQRTSKLAPITGAPEDGVAALSMWLSPSPSDTSGAVDGRSRGGRRISLWRVLEAAELVWHRYAAERVERF